MVLSDALAVIASTEMLSFGRSAAGRGTGRDTRLQGFPLLPQTGENSGNIRPIRPTVPMSGHPPLIVSRSGHGSM